MSYQVLARKWRPRSFDTLVGQEHVVRALTHALEQRRLHHAYLFTGTRGVGKTTIARILAKALNCETGITAAPCGLCGSCLEIDAGRFVDLIEVDAATNTRVDEMRQLLENATYAPTRGRFKVYVIDEVHMLSTSAFNAMLKTLEEPPEHIKFILATTDPQKIPVTVLSRCLQFNLKQMPMPHIVGHLEGILGKEAVPFEAAALRHLAKAAAGSMRDALSLLDQAIAHGAGKVEEEAVRDMLGTVGDDHLYALLDALAAQDVGAMLAVADAMNARTLSFEAALQEFAVLLHRIALQQMAPAAISDDAERARLAPHAEAFDPEFLQLAYQIAIHAREDLPLAPDEYTGFSMALLRLHAFRPEQSAAGAAGGGGQVPARSRAAPPAVTPATTASPQPVEQAGARRATSQAAERPAPAAMPAQREMAPVAAEPAGGVDWRGLIDAMQINGMVRELAQHCELIESNAGSFNLRLTSTHKHLFNPALKDKLQNELQSHFGRPVRVNIEIGEVSTATPAQKNREEQRARHEQAVAALEQDGFVQNVIDMFDATLNESSVKPL
ncbi:MAG TPA: DNA polymerase III subunit gamma/tau [Rhodocyclaceae bacterium]|nr:DNA polymerase III subunit gamma/tau [Rhodocyclaceae bacterium]HMZ84821.1 DNA polymerase III subunit gamma/tau [Rhodocyclaceae bacterium]HNA04372.1 DNA polymerase III subunit gamma/tau [Rhodocyclaceae bacterium]HNB77874.1 DNA polymerase III subunit gamma/tau [Rhodocyclaceae bacterium]HNH12855.1 DNA polymerase III subunit gamma/tau [Rhodocyclaceae bacterium]